MIVKQRVTYRVNEATGCWEFLGSKMQNGYGRAWDGKKVTSAHRAYYTIAGRQIPDGFVLDHLCRNPICVNPDHMEPVPYGENNRRGLLGKLTATQVRDIRVEYSTGATSYRALARKYGCSNMHIANLVNGIKCKDVGGPTKRPFEGYAVGGE